MSPDKHSRKRGKRRTELPATHGPVTPSSDDSHEIVFFKREKADDPKQAIPGREFLNSTCPPKVAATMYAVLTAVAQAPPKRFSGGGMWEAMHDDMTGWFEVRVNGPGRRHYRLFCRLDYSASNPEWAGKPLLVIITGLDKPFQTTLAAKDYRRVRSLGDEYLSRNPRSLA